MVRIILILTSFIISPVAWGQTSTESDRLNCYDVNFESIPGGSPSEGLAINNQFRSQYGISFTTETGNAPVLADVGGRATAFQGDNGNDTPAPGHEIGSFFLTDDGKLQNLEAPPVIINFDSLISTVEGVLLDVDFDENFTVDARDAAGNTLQSVTVQAGGPMTGDAQVTPWQIRRGVNEIASVRIEGRRESAGYFGLGLDNIRFCSVKPLSPKEAVQTFVEVQLRKWQQRGKFEKIEDYEARVNEDTRAAVQDSLTKQALTQVAEERIDWSTARNTYDADTEAFTIRTEHLEPFKLAVPIDEAEAFDANFSELQYLNPAYALGDGDGLEVAYVEVTNPATGKTYVYDSEQ